MNVRLSLNTIVCPLFKASALLRELVWPLTCASVILSISACTTLNPTLDPPISNQLASPNELEQAPEEDRPEPPRLELDAALLEQLMIANFASYAGDWDSALSSALSAAELSQDFRLARMASVLALRSRSYSEVAQASELWHELDADNEDAYNALLIGLVGSGQVEKALQQFDERLSDIENAKAVEEQNQTDVNEESATETVVTYQANASIDIHMRQVAGLLVRQVNSDSAMEICEVYVGRHSDSAQALLSMAYVASHFEQEDRAKQWLDQALVLRPNWDVAAQMYANMLARQEKYTERLAYIRLYIMDNPQSVVMRIQYAAELARQEDFQTGLDVMQEVIVDDPDNSNAIIYAAALAQELEQTELSQDLYEKALVLEPNDENVLWSLAGFAIADENYRKAERYYERVKEGRNYFRAQLQIANMRYEIAGLDSAINALRRLEPRTEGEYIEIALARHYLLMQEGEYEDAFGYINDSLVYLPESDDLIYARALVAAQLKEISIAETDFRSIIKRNPEHANALNALGYTLADQTNRYEEAKVLIAKALELRPEDGHILDSMGWVLYRLRDFEGAISYLKQAFDVMPEAEVAAHLGEVYWENGQEQLALEIWQKAYEMDASNEVLIQTLERYGQHDIYANTAN